MKRRKKRKNPKPLPIDRDKWRGCEDAVYEKE